MGGTGEGKWQLKLSRCLLLIFFYYRGTKKLPLYLLPLTNKYVLRTISAVNRDQKCPSREAAVWYPLIIESSTIATNEKAPVFCW